MEIRRNLAAILVVICFVLSSHGTFGQFDLGAEIINKVTDPPAPVSKVPSNSKGIFPYPFHSLLLFFFFSCIFVVLQHHAVCEFWSIVTCNLSVLLEM